jgi:hypothetical protein
MRFMKPCWPAVRLLSTGPVRVLLNGLLLLLLLSMSLLLEQERRHTSS